MIVKVLEEHGYESALKGMALSYYDHIIPFDEWWTIQKREKAVKRLKLLAFKGGGHSKALESICVWIYVQASRSFWQEFDTYRVGVTKNSSSTMHTLDKRYANSQDFEEETNAEIIYAFNKVLESYKTEGNDFYKDISRLKNHLPEGWLQERQICTNYMTLQNILRQREKHRLKYWQVFREEILKQIQHPELLVDQTS